MPAPPQRPPARVGVIGTGFIARSLFDVTRPMVDLSVSRALTRRPLDRLGEVGSDVTPTHSVQELIDHSDVVVECSGDVVHATEVIAKVMAAGLPVVTMNSEFHVTCGSHFVDKGYLTEAEGDQPGSTAALHKDVVSMGFEPVVYGNMKGFLNLDPSEEDMLYWSERQGIRVEMTTSFTDGTKVQIEQAFIANMFGADIAQTGLLALHSDDFNGAARELGDVAARLGRPISDFVVSAGQVPGVFIVARHNEVHQPMLRYLKLGDGPHYVLVRPYHLCALEIPKTIRAALAGEPPLLNNSARPRISVSAVAKRAIRAGETIEVGVGSFKVRGQAVRTADAPDHVPIGLLQNATITRNIAPGQTLHRDDVDLPANYAVELWGQAPPFFRSDFS